MDLPPLALVFFNYLETEKTLKKIFLQNALKRNTVFKRHDSKYKKKTGTDTIIVS